MESIQSHIAVIALGLILTLFGHDVLMVAGPHAPTLDHAAEHESQSPANDESCGPTTGAYPQIANLFNVDVQSAGQPILLVPPQVTGFFPHWSVDPDHPPATKRALLQVYQN